MTNEILAFSAGILVGVTGTRHYDQVRHHFTPSLPPDELETIADDLETSSRKLHELSKIMHRLAAGDDMEVIESSMSAETKQGWEAWKQEHNIH